eukprot:scaffold128798_cov40-Tisochrysis_lutea.AAC.2
MRARHRRPRGSRANSSSQTVAMRRPPGLSSAWRPLRQASISAGGSIPTSLGGIPASAQICLMSTCCVEKRVPSASRSPRSRAAATIAASLSVATTSARGNLCASEQAGSP